MHEYFEATAFRHPTRIALRVDGADISYRELDESADLLAGRLIFAGVTEGSRVALLVERSRVMYVGLLAALKTGATLVPIDPASPADRVDYIVQDAGVDHVLCTADLGQALENPTLILDLDELLSTEPAMPQQQPVVSGAMPNNPAVEQPDPIAYIIYTSGSSGRPKGVQVAQSSICNFIHVVCGLYNVGPHDRVYQGMSVAFDFSIEEIWPTWATGATLVAGPTDGRHLAADLGDFLAEEEVTVLYCVPTVLSTIDRDLPAIHTLNVGGEACPQHLVERWAGPHRLMLNTYGPTEATVTCIYTELVPGRPVTIGFPVPTYALHLLDDDLQPVAEGAEGEICIGGPGVAVGYIGRDDLTAERFIDYPGAGRIYRTGDLGRMTEWGVEYRGRADDEVKVRGKRVDLGEIEAQLRECAGVNDAVVALTPDGELAAYVTLHEDVDPATVPSAAGQELSAVLPAYMMPSTLRILPAMPMLTSGKVDRKQLPEPGARLVLVEGDVVAARTTIEQEVAAMWAEALGVPVQDLSVTADFFTALSGHSLAAALAVSQARVAYPAAGLSIADLYAHPTVEAFAGLLGERLDEAPAPVQEAGPNEPLRMSYQPRSWPNRLRRLVTGFSQAALIYLLVSLVGLPVAVAYTDYDGSLSADLMWELVTWVPIAYLAARWVLPVPAIRLFSIGVRPGNYPMWGRVHLQTWAIRRLMELSPATALAGSPMFAWYLRALGARVGKRCHIATAQLGVPGLIDIGDDASIGYGAHLQPVSIRTGRVSLERVSIADRAFVGSSSLVAEGGRIGVDGVLTEHSVISPGGCVPDGEVWGGSPATAAPTVNPLLEEILVREPAPQQWTPRLRLRMLGGLLCLELLPFLAIAPAVSLVWWSMLTHGLLVGFLATLLAGPLYVLSACAVLGLARAVVVDSTPEGVFALASPIGVQRWFVDKIFELSLVLTNSLFATLYTPVWLRLLGAKIGRGSEVSTLAHVDPELLDIADEGFVADMAHVGSAVCHRGYLAMARTVVGSRAFVGNASFVPAGSSLQPDSLVGVHTLAPGIVPAGTSWLGSPAIYLPHRQESQSFDERLTFNPSRRQVIERGVFEFFRATAPASILGCSVYLALISVSQVSRGQPYPVVAVLTPLLLLAGSCLTVLLSVAAKWVIVGDYAQRVEPLWSRFVRKSELVTGLYEAAAVPVLLHMLCGTPFLAPVLRLFGARIGRRVYLDTTYFTEFDLVDIGDDVSVGSGVSLQTHLFEDRVMKMSTVTLQDASDIGDRAVVLYDAVVQPQSIVGPLSLVMKGESLPAGTRWLGVPARQVA
ncbi:MAG: peptide synthetase [Micrococcales bacterium]|nr:MAG: peptide synthetase [Micrococcales bacterium]